MQITFFISSHIHTQVALNIFVSRLIVNNSDNNYYGIPKTILTDFFLSLAYRNKKIIKINLCDIRTKVLSSYLQYLRLELM